MISRRQALIAILLAAPLGSARGQTSTTPQPGRESWENPLDIINIRSVLADLEAGHETPHLGFIAHAIQAVEHRTQWSSEMQEALGDRNSVLGKLWLQYAISLLARIDRPSVNSAERIRDDTSEEDRAPAERSDVENREYVLNALNQALQGLSERETPRYWADALVSHGATTRELGDPDDPAVIETALNDYLAALRVYTRATYSTEFGRVSYNVALCYLARRQGDDIERSIAAFRDSLSVISRDSLVIEWAQRQGAFGDAWFFRVMGTRRDNLRNADAAFSDSVGVFTPLVSPRINIFLNARLALVRVELEAWDGARQAANAGADSADQIIGVGVDQAASSDALDVARGLYQAGAFAAAMQGDAAGSMAFLERGKARLLRMALSIDELDLEPTERLELRQLIVAIGEIESHSGAARGSDPGLQPMRYRASQLLARGSGQAQSSPPRFDAGYLIAPIDVRTGSLVITANASGDLRMQTTASGRAVGLGAVASLTSDWLRLQGRGDISGAVNRLDNVGWHGLGDRIGAALRQCGAPSGAEIAVLLDGLLNFIPIGLAIDPHTGRRLIEDYALSIVPSLHSLQNSMIARRTARPISLASFSPPSDLPYADAEVRAIQNYFGIRILATTHSLSDLAGASHWHLAGHASFGFGEPGRLAIRLADRTLTLADLRRELPPAHPRLVVLSACSTGLTDYTIAPNEFEGLPMAFLRAGAGAVLATLWEVRDISTALLVDEFYRRHRAEGMEPALALRAAQIWLASAQRPQIEARLARLGALERHGQSQIPAGIRPFANPYHWGGFVLYRV